MSRVKTQPRTRSSRTAFVHEFNSDLVDWLNDKQAAETLDDRRPLQTQSVIHRVSWSTYRSLLRAIVRKGVRHSYRNGTLELMAPRTYWSEWCKSIARRFAQHLSSELEVNLKSLGRVPIVSSSQRLGLEPDEAFAITLRGRTRVRPNLVIEVIDGSPDSKTISLDEHAVSRMRLLQEMGIAEVWLVREWSVTIFANHSSRRCKTAGKSVLCWCNTDNPVEESGSLPTMGRERCNSPFVV